MKKHYDFSKAKPNPYAKRLKKQVTIRLDEDALTYFQQLAEETGIAYLRITSAHAQAVMGATRSH